MYFATEVVQGLCQRFEKGRECLAYSFPAAAYVDVILSRQDRQVLLDVVYQAARSEPMASIDGRRIRCGA